MPATRESVAPTKPSDIRHLQSVSARVKLASDHWSKVCRNFGVVQIEREGVHAVVNKATGECYYKKWFTKGICKYVGWAYRSQPNWKYKGMLDATVQSWVNASGHHWENKYHMCHPQPDSNYRGTSKYEREQPVLDQEAWYISGEWTYKHWMPYMSNSVVVEHDIATAEAIKTTSPGYPHNLAYPKKRDYFDSEEFISNQEDYYERLSTDNPIPTFWNLADKYELRAKTKTVLGKIRAFCASSATHSHANTRLCHDMNRKFYKSAGRTVSFVGATKYYGGWNRLINRLKRHKLGFELDESDYDASIFREALWGQCDLRFRMLRPDHQTPENMMRLHNLYYDIVHSIMVTPLGDVIVKDTGNPSGQGNTIVDNTMILYRLLCYAWIVLWKKQFSGDAERLKELQKQLIFNEVLNNPNVDEVSIEEEITLIKKRALSQFNFHANVEMVLNGDDNTFTCSDDVNGWFNARNVAEVWTNIGVTTKSPSWDPLPVEQLNFLSHSTRYDEGMGLYLPVPEHERIMDSLLHASNNPDVRWSLLRAYALRIESWPNLKTREAIWSYINYIWTKHADWLSGSVMMIKTGEWMTYTEIANILMSDKELEKLYGGYECSESSPGVRSFSELERVQKFVDAASY